MHGREHDATVFADHVVVVGLADLLHLRLLLIFEKPSATEKPCG